MRMARNIGAEQFTWVYSLKSLNTSILLVDDALVLFFTNEELAVYCCGPCTQYRRNKDLCGRSGRDTQSKFEVFHWFVMEHEQGHQMRDSSGKLTVHWLSSKYTKSSIIWTCLSSSHDKKYYFFALSWAPPSPSCPIASTFASLWDDFISLNGNGS